MPLEEFPLQTSLEVYVSESLVWFSHLRDTFCCTKFPSFTSICTSSRRTASQKGETSLLQLCLTANGLHLYSCSQQCHISIHIHIGRLLLRLISFGCDGKGYRMVPFNLKVLAKFGLCSNCSQQLDECSLAGARKIFASSRMLGFSLKFPAVWRKHHLHL